MQAITISRTSPVTQDTVLRNTVYIVSDAIESDRPAITAALARAFGVSARRYEVAQIYSEKRKGIYAADLRFIVLSPDATMHLQSEISRVLALLTPGAYAIIATHESAGVKKACTTAGERSGSAFSIESLKMTDKRLDPLGLSDEDREEIYDDGYFTAVTRTS